MASQRQLRASARRGVDVLRKGLIFHKKIVDMGSILVKKKKKKSLEVGRRNLVMFYESIIRPQNKKKADADFSFFPFNFSKIL